MDKKVKDKTSIIFILQNLKKHFTRKNLNYLYIFLTSSILCGILEIINLYFFSLILKYTSNPNFTGNPFLEKIITFNKLNIYPNNNGINFCISVFIICTSLTTIIKIYNVKIRYRLAASIGSELSSKAFWLTINQPYLSLTNKNTSETTVVLSRYIVDTISTIIGIAALSSSIILIISITISLFLINFKLTIFIIIFFFTIYILTYKYQKNKLLYNSSLVKKYTNLQIKTIQESLGFIKEIILNSMQINEYKKYYEIDRKMRNAECNNFFLLSMPRILIENIGFISITIFILILGMLGLSGSSIIAVVGSFALGSQKMLPAFNLVYSSLANIKSSAYAIINVLDYLNQTDPYSNKIFYKDRISIKNDIKIEKLSFFYPSNPKNIILNNIDLDIKKGENVGLIGSTGSGKTTLVNLILSLIKPTSGNIIIDGLNLYSSSKYLNKWRNSIAHIPQTIYLADTTLEENITLLKEKEINYKLLKQVCKLSLLDGLIKNLPNKLKTIVGERGVRFSGGQLQRIGIARALYRQSSILILDEATSALDVETESQIIKNIETEKDKKIIITIAHRIETLKNCDYWIFINNGSIKFLNKYNDVVKAFKINK